MVKKGFFLIWIILNIVTKVEGAHALPLDQPIVLAQEKIDDLNLKSDEVLVIANSASADSMEVAKYYMERRRIPKEHLFTIAFPNHNHRKAISHEDFQNKIALPLQQFIEKNQLKEKILCFVTVYDVPYQVAGPIISTSLQDELEKALPPNSRRMAKQLLTGRASVDSELSWLYRSDVYAHPLGDPARERAYSGRSQNLYFAQGMKFRQFRKQILKDENFQQQVGLFYMTARLEAPTVALAKGLVDLAIKAEREGPKGIGCFDARKETIGKVKTGYDLGEVWVRRAFIETHNAGFDTILDEKTSLIEKGACRNTLFYWGWYALKHYKNIFQSRFAPGAITVHTASGEAADIRHFSNQGRYPWCAGLLAHGATICIGPITEPFLDAFPHSDLFYPRIFNGWSAGEAYWASKAQISWMMVMIGDPLYVPFSEKNKLKTYVTGKIRFTQGKSFFNTTALSGNMAYAVEVVMKAMNPIFKETDQYKISKVKTSDSETFHLNNFQKARFEIWNQGSRLVIKGLTLDVGQVWDLRQGELEITIDLGDGLGKKIISQLFSINPPHKASDRP